MSSQTMRSRYSTREIDLRPCIRWSPFRFPTRCWLREDARAISGRGAIVHDEVGLQRIEDVEDPLHLLGEVAVPELRAVRPVHTQSVGHLRLRHAPSDPLGLEGPAEAGGSVGRSWVTCVDSSRIGSMEPGLSLRPGPATVSGPRVSVVLDQPPIVVLDRKSRRAPGHPRVRRRGPRPPHAGRNVKLRASPTDQPKGFVQAPQAADRRAA